MVLGPPGRTGSMSKPTVAYSLESQANGHPSTILGAILTYIRQHSCNFLLPTPEDALPSARYPQMPLAIKSVTPITCNQSQITGESTCPMDAYVSSGNRLINSMSLTTSMTWLIFYEPGSRTISLNKSDFEASANPQDTARNARFSSKAGSRTKTSKRRKAQGRLQENKMLVCSPVCSLPTRHPRGRSALCYAQWLPPDRWLRVVALLVVLPPIKQ